MILRPVDADGDVLPVMSSADLVSGPEAVALLVRDRLNLLAGEWWEYPEMGFSILGVMQERRITEGDASMLSSMITAYIRETPGVRDVGNVRFSAEGRQFSYSCEVLTEDGTAAVEFVL